MKTHIYTLAILITLFFNACILSAQDVEVKNLKCNFQIEPLSIDNKTPGLSWEIYSSQQRNIMQESYQVLVATSEELLNEKNTDVWNSGIVESDQSVQILYNGKVLSSGTRYYWKVRIKDKNGIVSPYSNVSFFETGLFEKTDWHAQWIAAPSVWEWFPFIKDRQTGEEEGTYGWDNDAPIFRKEFKLSEKVKSARMYVSGLGLYEAYLNGNKIGNHQLDPAFTRYDKTVLYATYDITSALKEENAIGVMLGNGWYNMFSKATWGFDHAPWRGKPRVIMQIEVIYDDNSKEIIVTDESWKTSPAPVTFNSIRQGVIYDARLEQDGWNQAGFNEENWLHASSISSPGGELRPQTIEPIRAYEELKPTKITKKPDGRYIIDFGKNIAGWARIKAIGKNGDEIILKYGEELAGDSVDQSNIDVYTQGIVQTDKFILKGGQQETFETIFTYHGFQYIEVFGYPGELTKGDITAMVAGTDFKSRGSFECSNPTINKIQQNTLSSFRANFYGFPADCPQREKNGWTGDAQLAVETGLWNFHSNSAYAKYLQDFADEQRQDGNLPGIIPTSGWGYHWGNGPAWIGAYAIIPWHMYLYDGDTKILAKHYDGIKKLVTFFTGKAENHILSFGLGDWAPHDTKTPVPLNSTAYYYHYTYILSQVASLLGHEEDHQYYTQLSSEIKIAFNNKFYDPKSGKYANGSQTAQSAALYLGLVNEKNKKKVVNQLLEAVKKTDYHIDAGILGAKYVPHALADNGHVNAAYKIMANETFPGWGWWIKQGATTLWEHWDGRKSKSHGSLNHIMFGDVSNWFFRNIAGIQPDIEQVGFKHFVVEPKLTDQLNWCNATYESVYGTIAVNWKKEDGKFTMKLDVPGNTTATVTLPASSAKKIHEGGKSLKQNNIEVLSHDKGLVTVQVGSGSYVFESSVQN